MKPVKLTIEKSFYKKILGVIIPIDWDNSGEAIQFALYSPDEEEIIIKDNKNHTRLRNLINQAVEITGPISLNAWGEPVIIPKKIKKLKNIPDGNPNLQLEEPLSIYLPSSAARSLDIDYLEAG